MDVFADDIRDDETSEWQRNSTLHHREHYEGPALAMLGTFHAVTRGTGDTYSDDGTQMF